MCRHGNLWTKNQTHSNLSVHCNWPDKMAEHWSSEEALMLFWEAKGVWWLLEEDEWWLLEEDEWWLLEEDEWWLLEPQLTLEGELVGWAMPHQPNYGQQMHATHKEAKTCR
jgi:hypothetical protein